MKCIARYMETTLLGMKCSCRPQPHPQNQSTMPHRLLQKSLGLKLSNLVPKHLAIGAKAVHLLGLSVGAAG